MPLVDARDRHGDYDAGDRPAQRETGAMAARRAKSERAFDRVAGEMHRLAEDEVDGLDVRRRKETAEEKGENRAAVG